MPDSRPADYYFGCLDDSVFIDFDDCEDGSVRLSRISFDGYGCCNLEDRAIPMNEIDSQAFKEIVRSIILDQVLLLKIIKDTILVNRKILWEDALSKYGLI